MGVTPLYIHIVDSLSRVGIAVGCASALGIVFGVLLGWSRWFASTVGVILEIFRPIPPLAWIPLITIWFGIGEFPKILIVFLGTFFNVVVNTSTGVKMVDKLQLDVGKIFGANQFQVLKEIVLPASLPAIFAGIRVALGAGWAVVLAAEMLGSQTGVGYLITLGNSIGDTALIFVCMIIIGVIGALLSAIATGIERRLLPMDGRTAKLSLRHISKTFYDKKGAHPTIDDVSFDVYDNEFLVILGPGLCGKTVLLNTVAGLEQATSGQIFLNGKELYGTDPSIGMVFQKKAIFPWKTVMQNVEFGPKMRGVSQSGTKKDGAEIY